MQEALSEGVGVVSEKIISFSETSRVRIVEFSDWFKKRNPEKMELLKGDDFIVTTGEAWRITIEIPHDCNCEYCDETEEYTEDIYNESEIEKKVEELMFEHDKATTDDYEVDKIFYVKAVRQNKDIGGLFA